MYTERRFQHFRSHAPATERHCNCTVTGRAKRNGETATAERQRNHEWWKPGIIVSLFVSLQIAMSFKPVAVEVRRRVILDLAPDFEMYFVYLLICILS